MLSKLKRAITMKLENKSVGSKLKFGVSKQS
jgi:hypothetical protein